MGVVYIDLEYTNGNYYMCDIIEIAAISERTDATYHTLVKIKDRIPPNVTKLTGMTDAELQAVGISFPDAFNGLIEFIRESTWDPAIISHGGIVTDLPLIVTNCMKHGIGYQYLNRCTFIDSVQAFQDQGYEKPGLDELCRISNIRSENRHNALDDAGIMKTLHGMYNTIFQNAFRYQFSYISQLLERKLPLEIKVLNVISANVSARQLTSILQELSEKNTLLKRGGNSKILYTAEPINQIQPRILTRHEYMYSIYMLTKVATRQWL